MQAPNALGRESWDEWLNERAKHTIVLSGGSAFDVPMMTEDKAPLLVTGRFGAGKMTYVALAVEKQLLNIHPGSFQLLANLLSY